MHNSGPRFEIRCESARPAIRKRDEYFHVGSNLNIDPCDERGAAPANIFTGRIFFHGHAPLIATPQFERKLHGDSPFRSVPRDTRMDSFRSPCPGFSRHVNTIRVHRSFFSLNFRRSVSDEYPAFFLGPAGSLYHTKKLRSQAVPNWTPSFRQPFGWCPPFPVIRQSSLGRVSSPPLRALRFQRRL
jgi:hypothetical protein